MGLKQVARNRFVDEICDDARKGAKVVTLRDKGITPPELAHILRKRGFYVEVKGLTLTVGKMR